MHTAPTQLWPNPRTLAQEPQLFGSVRVSVSQPLPTRTARAGRRCLQVFVVQIALRAKGRYKVGGETRGGTEMRFPKTRGVGILLMVLAISACGGDSSDSSSGGPGIASPEVQAGFPVYAQSQLSTMIALVDGAFLDRTAILRALAASAEVKTARWESMRGLFTDFQNAWGDAGIYWFVLPDGNYYTVEQGLVGQSLADREYFPRVMSGETVIGSLVVSKATGKKSVVMVAPVQSDPTRVIGGVGASLFLEKLNETLGQALSLPEGMVFYALAPDGTTTLHYNFAMIFENPLEMDNPSLQHAAEVMLATTAGEVEYEYNGFRKRVRYLASSLTQWRFALGVNIDVASPGS